MAVYARPRAAHRRVMMPRHAAAVLLAAAPVAAATAAAPYAAACTGDHFAGQCIKCNGAASCTIIKSVKGKPTDDECCAACASTDGCGFWVNNMGNGMCYLKQGESSDKQSGNCNSGVLPPPPPTPAPPPPPPAPAGAKNVLYIVVDDLRPELAGGYDQAYAKTPHLAQLASESLVFERAYCQYALCGPSRNSFMTGRRPDSTKAYTFGRHFRMPDVGPSWTSFPEHFKNNGYLVLGSGKLYHHGLPPNFDTPLSWSPENNPYVDDSTSPCNAGSYSDISQSGIKWCSINNTALEPKLGDNVNSARVIGQLRSLNTGWATLGAVFAPVQADPRPFFIGLGFHKPHMPFAVPDRYYDLYPPAEEVPLAKHRNAPVGMPDVAFNPTGGYTPTQPMPEGQERRARRAYMAAISYTDELVGDVLAALNGTGRAAQTLVVFHADHGWQLGEHGEWRKMTNFELGVRVPLIVRAPWTPSAVGKRTSALVELVDVFPTVTALAGLSPPAGEPVPLEGASFAAVFSDPGATLAKQYALSQYARCPQSGKPEWKGNGCPNDATNAKISVMGYSLRLDKWRYTEWAHFDGAAGDGTGSVDWAKPLHGRELYDHRTGDENDFDFHENTNLVNETQYADLVASLSQQLRALVANTTAH